MLYDRFGSELITEFDQFGSFGLATTLNNPVSYTFSTSPRYNGSCTGAAGRSHHRLSLHSARRQRDRRRIPGDLSGPEVAVFHPAECVVRARAAGQTNLEVSYAGRLSRKLLLQGDVYTPLENLADPASGQTWLSAMTTIRNTYNSICASLGNTTQNCSPSCCGAGGMNNPSLVPNNRLHQDMFPGVSAFPGVVFPGNASPAALISMAFTVSTAAVIWTCCTRGPNSRTIYRARHLRHPSSAATHSLPRREAPCPPG